MPRTRSQSKVTVDGQKHNHREKYAYDFDDWPEFYDMWVEAFISSWPAEDVGVFRELLEDRLKQIEMHNLPGPINVIDIGTGTGRVILDLWRQDINGAECITYWGIDHSQAMLDRAKCSFDSWKRAIKGLDEQDKKESKRESLSVVPNWVLTPASGFLSAMPSVQGHTDLIIFAAGGISHLVTDAEMEMFLKDVAQALRPSPKGAEALAVISVLHEMNPLKNSKLRKVMEDVPIEETKVNKEFPSKQPLHGTNVVLEIPSREHPGVYYIRSPVVSRWTSDDVRTDSFKFRCCEKSKNDDGTSEEETVSEGTLEWSLRVFDQAAWEELAEKCGLSIYGSKDGKFQDYIYLARKDALYL